QVLQRPLRLRAAIPVAYGRPARGVPGLRTCPEARRQPGRRSQRPTPRPQPIEPPRTFEMDGPAANFPDINFVIFHVGLPWLDEVLWQIVRFPNLYASIAATVNFIARQPRVFAEILGKMMWWCGEDKIIYGGESPIWHP